MKINKLRDMGLGLLIITLCAGVSSCSLFNKDGGKAGGGKVRQEATLPQDRENIAQINDLKVYTPEEIKQGVVKGDWAIEEVNGKPAVGEKAPFLKFVPAEKRVYGHNGCNVINAKYSYNPADSTLSFSDIASTMMMCHLEGITDVEINQALSSTCGYTWSVEGSEYHLHFYDKAGKDVMRLMHQNFDFLNGTWGVRAINDEKVNVVGMKLVIDVDEGKLHGNTGCNILNGKMEIDMDQANSISFSAIGVTRMACPDMPYETPLVVALEEACAAKPINADEVILFNAGGKQVLRLVRTTDRQ